MPRSRIYERPDRDSLYLLVYDPFRHQEYRESAHTNDPKLAGLRLAQLEAQVASGTYLPPAERRHAESVSAVSLHSAIADYVSHLIREGAADSHCQTSAYHLFHLLEFVESHLAAGGRELPARLEPCRLRLARRKSTPDWEIEKLLAPSSSDCPLSALTPQTIDRFKAYRLSVARADATSVNGSLKVVRSFGRWLVERDFAERNPARGVKAAPDLDPSARRCLSLVELNSLSGAATGELRDWFLVTTLHGLRKTETAMLRQEDIDLDEGCIRIRNHWNAAGEIVWSPKFRRERVVPIVEEALPLMLRVSQRVPTSTGHLFGPKDRRKAMASALRRAGVEGHVTAHDLRHTAYTHLKEGVLSAMDPQLALAEIRYIFGHGDRSMDRVYDHRNVERLRKLVALSDLPEALLGHCAPKRSALES